MPNFLQRLVEIVKGTEPIKEEQVAAPQKAVISEDRSYQFDLLTNGNRAYEFDGLSPRSLRLIETKVSPVSWCVQRRKMQIAEFSRPATVQSGHITQPGFRIRMTDRDAVPTASDREIMKELELMISRCGFADPPVNERPRGWQPSFTHFLSCFIEDSLVLDWAIMRTWYPRLPKIAKYGLSCFSYEDSGRIRFAKPADIDVKRGQIVHTPQESERISDPRGDILYVKMDTDANGGQPIAQYTASEVSHFVRNGSSDEGRNGYGYSEIQKALLEVNQWVKSMSYNGTRFDADTLPRGFISLFGDVNPDKMNAFRAEWKQLMSGGNGGGRKRWGVPIFHGISKDAKVEWTPLDMSSRDMEYSQWLFILTNSIHSHYGIHPEETGASGNSPFRPPLSEASPESTLEYSQGTPVSSYLNRVEEFMNHRVMYVAVPSRRYSFEFVGKGSNNDADTINLYATELQAGLNTPRNIYGLRDIEIPEPLKDSPAWDLPMPIAEGLQYLDGMAQAQREQQAAEQQQLAQAQRPPQDGSAPTQMPPPQGGQTQ